MKFMQLLDFYPAYLTNLHQRYPELKHQSFALQQEMLFQDGFYGNHMFAPYLKAFGYETQFMIINDPYSQKKWMEEQGFATDGLDLTQVAQTYVVAQKQVQAFQPDILFISTPIIFDSHFIRFLAKRPPFVIGWRAAHIGPTVDWTEFDLILSNVNELLETAMQRGARGVAKFHPGFPNIVLDQLNHIPDLTKKRDVSFAGQITTQHLKRHEHLKEIGKWPLGLEGEFSIDYFIGTFFEQGHPFHTGLDLAVSVFMYNHGGLWGMDMYRMLAESRICFNDLIDIAAGQSGNMRLFETTGVGSFLLTEWTQDLGQFFELGQEIESYQSLPELKEKIYYYLNHPEAREAIAKNGQARCLRDYSMEKRAKELTLILDELTRLAS